MCGDHREPRFEGASFYSVSVLVSAMFPCSMYGRDQCLVLSEVLKYVVHL